MINDAPSADQKPLTSNLVLQLAVSVNIAALMMKIKRPKVTSETGKVSTFRIEPRMLLINPKSSATQK